MDVDIRYQFGIQQHLNKSFQLCKHSNLLYIISVHSRHELMQVIAEEGCVCVALGYNLAHFIECKFTNGFIWALL